MIDDIYQQQQGELVALLQGRLAQLKRSYIRRINQDLTQHRWQGMLGNNIKSVIQELLDELQSELIAQIQRRATVEERVSFVNLAQENILQLVHEFTHAAIQHNRTSCALSNFGAEHKPDQGYLDEIAVQTQDQLAAFFAFISNLSR